MSGLDVQTEWDVETDAVVRGRGAVRCVAAVEAGAHTLDVLGNGPYHICTSAPMVAQSAWGRGVTSTAGCSIRSARPPQGCTQWEASALPAVGARTAVCTLPK